MPITKFIPKQKRMPITPGRLLILVSRTMFLFSLLKIGELKKEVEGLKQALDKI